MINSKKILITGASRGIGLELSKSFSVDGHLVYASNSKEFDLSKKESVISLFEKYKDADVLINNAGYCDKFEIDDDISKFENMFSINTFAPIHLSILFSNHWIATKTKGKIINVTSRVAIKGSLNSPHYAASKAALESFTHSWALKVISSDIGIFGIAPSWVDTDILTNNVGDRAVEINSLPIKRFLEPKELYPYFKFIVENNCQYMTGQITDVNGASYFR